MENNGQRFSKKEIAWIKTLFEQGRSDEDIALTLGRSVGGVCRKRGQMGLYRPDAIAISIEQGHKWTDEELLFIKNYGKSQTDTWMAKKLGVTVRAYRYQRRRMGIGKSWTNRKGYRKSWTWTQEAFLREHYPTRCAIEIGHYLGRSTKSVRNKALRLGIKKDFPSAPTRIKNN